MFTASWDEPFALPSEESTTLALRTQQILAYETGVTRVADPLGGSWFVEALTDEMEAKIERIMSDLESRGGMVHAIESGYVQGLISEEAYRRQQGLDAGVYPVVGVNRFQTDEPIPEVNGYELDERGRATQLERLAEVKRSRESRVVTQHLLDLELRAHDPDVNLMPSLIAAVKAYCTVGEISDALRNAWGEYEQPTQF